MEDKPQVQHEVISPEIAKAIGTLHTAFKDADYRRAWKDNIAMSFKDEVYRYRKHTGKTHLSAQDFHIIANQAAENFLNLLTK